MNSEIDIMQINTETIKHAAVKSVSGWIIFGKCHADCIHKAKYINVETKSSGDSQGFVTSEGRYVNRAEAYNIALRAMQIEPQVIDESCDLFGAKSDKIHRLFSEDLWSKQHNGKFNYCEIKGYIQKDEQPEPVTTEEHI